jgi:hypothetical protein
METPQLATLLLLAIPGTLTHIKALAKVMVGGGGTSFLECEFPRVDYMHGKGFAARLILAFSSSIFCIIGVLSVNDTDLFAMAEYPLESAE